MKNRNYYICWCCGHLVNKKTEKHLKKMGGKPCELFNSYHAECDVPNTSIRKQHGNCKGKIKGEFD